MRKIKEKLPKLSLRKNRRYLRKPYKPYLEASLSLGFIGFRTEVMHYPAYMDAYVYIALKWHFFKWNGSFRLYRPGKDIRNG